ncbi:MAG TPA: MDR family MFS transporter [Candidatus Limnocylindria bacterium]
MSADRITGRRLVAVTIGILLALFLVALDQFVVGSAMPRIVAELHGLDSYSWVLTAYLVSLTTVTPIAGKLGDLFGRRSVLLVGMVGFALSSALCGQAADMTQLIAFRAVQGVFGGLLFSNVFASVADLFAMEARVRVQGALGGVFGIASLVGPTIGGYLTDGAGWRWAFYVNLPVSAVAIALVLVAMPRIRSTASLRDVDLAGALTLAGGLVPLLVGVSITRDHAWGSGEVLGLLAIATVMLVVFVGRELRARDPIVPLALFTDRTFTVAVVAGFFIYVAFFSALLFVPLLYQGVLGIRPSDSGVLVTPMLLGLIAGSVIAGQLMLRVSRYRYLGTGATLLVALGAALLAQTTIASDQQDVVRALVILGAGIGVTIPLYLNSAQAAVERRLVGVVTSQVQFWRQIGGTIGVAVLGSLLSARLPASANVSAAQVALPSPVRIAIAGGLHDVFIDAALCAVVALVASFFLRETAVRRRRGELATAPVEAAAD